MSTTIAKKECTCYKCKATIKAGEKAQWYQHTIQSNGHLSKSSVQWKLVCADEKACGERIGNAFLAKEAARKQEEAQETLNFLREQAKEHGWPVVVEQACIAKYAAEGIVVK